MNLTKPQIRYLKHTVAGKFHLNRKRLRWDSKDGILRHSDTDTGTGLPVEEATKAVIFKILESMPGGIKKTVTEAPPRLDWWQRLFLHLPVVEGHE